MIISERHIPPAGDPFAAAHHGGDAAYQWHALDATLGPLAHARDALETAGYEELAEHVEELVEAVEVEHETVERLVMTSLAREEQ